mgnify:CR=1 FL=1
MHDDVHELTAAALFSTTPLFLAQQGMARTKGDAAAVGPGSCPLPAHSHTRSGSNVQQQPHRSSHPQLPMADVCMINSPLSMASRGSQESLFHGTSLSGPQIDAATGCVRPHVHTWHVCVSLVTCGVKRGLLFFCVLGCCRLECLSRLPASSSLIRATAATAETWDSLRAPSQHA